MTKDNKLLEEAYDKIKASSLWTNTDPPKGNRKLAAIETINDKSINQKLSLIIANEVKGLGYNCNIIKVPDNNYEVLVYSQVTPEIKEGVRLYQIYVNSDEWSKTKAQGLTKEQHTFLGKLFGFSNKDIKWFIDDVFDNVESGSSQAILEPKISNVLKLFLRNNKFEWWDDVGIWNLKLETYTDTQSFVRIFPNKNYFNITYQIDSKEKILDGLTDTQVISILKNVFEMYRDKNHL